MRARRPLIAESLVALAYFLQLCTAGAPAVAVHIGCDDLHHCEGQFSTRGQRICLAKELVDHLETAAQACPGLGTPKPIRGKQVVSTVQIC